jgi:Flp pilus assembly protein TadG
VNVRGIRRGGDLEHGRVRGRARGQALVEFAIALIPFLFLLMGVIDLGRGIYTNNGASQAAREIARAASVHPCTGSCTAAEYSSEIASTIATQKGLIPGLTSAGIQLACTDVGDNIVTKPAGIKCPVGDYIRVKVTVTFRLVSPLLPVPNPMTLTSTTHMLIP